MVIGIFYLKVIIIMVILLMLGVIVEVVMVIVVGLIEILGEYFDLFDNCFM